MNKKAEKFQQFITEHNLQDSFSISEHTEAGRDFVLFDTSVEVGGQYLKVVVILDEGLQTIIRMWVGHLINSQNKKHVLTKLNQLNTEYKGFKFFLDGKNNVIMDWINSTPDDLFDPHLVHFTLGVINRESEYIHNAIMSFAKI
ncbi:hypothetical protein GKC56_00825 [Neisseriaceae bacterium PsAf]|nr:hypothetical protein [Neisseriaceae bacterium PsAf]MCV2503503.1 hypothetical protein [Neisseriaceae bacterium]